MVARWESKEQPKDLVHIFEATSSLSICVYALRRTLRTTDVLTKSRRDFYVDDPVKSFDTTGQAVDITKELQGLLEKRGFQLSKVMSNESLNAFPPEHCAPAVKDLYLNLNNLPTDQALGIHWDVQANIFNFVVSNKPEPETRRNILSSIVTIYDTLGLAAPLILPGREINQELSGLKYDWNHKLPVKLAVQW